MRLAINTPTEEHARVPEASLADLPQGSLAEACLRLQAPVGCISLSPCMNNVQEFLVFQNQLCTVCVSSMSW